MVYNWLNNALSKLYPPVCVLCGARHKPGPEKTVTSLCPGCLQDIQPRELGCPLCGVPQPRQQICGPCQKHPPPQDALWTAYSYQLPLDTVLKHYKYEQRLAHGRVLQELFTIAVQQALANQTLTKPDLIVPVPLHPKKLRQRGFNQSLELARPIAKTLQVQLNPHLLTRTRVTEPQAHLPHKSRRKNVRAAFQCKTSLKDQRIVIIDDVVTTGSTIGEVTKELKKSGAAYVEVWTFSRAEGK